MLENSSGDQMLAKCWDNFGEVTESLAETRQFEAVEPVRIAVVVCTFRRNGPLERLLRAVERNAATLPPGVDLGVVVVDDNSDARARSVCDAFEGSFTLGLHYRHVGKGNISIARNTGLEAALGISDWIAMTDDDCEPVDHWISSYLEMQGRTGVVALTGPCELQPPPGSPSWLSEQPFLTTPSEFFDQQEIGHAATNNSFFSAQFFRDHPEIRFDPDLGVVGGEDMVFFRSAHAAGLSIVYCAASMVVGHEPAERATFRSQVRSWFWFGNTEFVTNRQLGDGGTLTWLLRSGRRFLAAVTRPLVRLARRQQPQFRFAVASGARALGNAAGVAGLRVRHH